MIPVILSGGSGSRLWPLSRKQHPKQFLKLVGNHSLFQQTVMRLTAQGLQAPIVVCNQEHRFMINEQLTAIGAEAQGLVLEPFGRNTAPAVAMVALKLVVEGRDDLLLVSPADHVVNDEAGLLQAVQNAAAAAEAGEMVLFGVPAQQPETGFGYIQCAPDARLGAGMQRVARFVEKPSLEVAQAFVDSGDYYWNSGMFLFRASRYLEELRRFEPDIYETCALAFESSEQAGNTLTIASAAFACCPDNSIDYAVMERTSQASLMPLEAGWNDVGSWSALWEVQPKNEEGNVLQGDVVVDDAQNCLVHANSKLVTLLGVEDLVVVETKDAVMVAHKDRMQDVRHLVQRLDQDQRTETQSHSQVYRPWGAYDSVDNGLRHQVKRITVKPGASLSLQMHHHRAEHWIVVSGIAQVTCDEKVFLLTENQSTYIPVASVHRLSNPGKIPLEIIEVQSGSYLGEDDIERLEDVYGRTAEKVEPPRLAAVVK